MKRVGIGILGAITGGLILGLVVPLLAHWIRGWYWPESGSGSVFSYAFFSSVGGCSVIGAGFGSNLALMWHRHNCHTHRCPRIGKHHLAGGKYVICTHCLKQGGAPEKLTLDHIHTEHAAHILRDAR